MNWYEEEYIFNPTRNSFIPFCWERQKDDVYCLWQFGEENHKKFLIYLNGNEKRIQWTQETEEKGTLPFLDMKITKNDNKIQIGIYRKEAHTLKYSSYDSYRPRNEQIGILKNMLHRAYNLCDPGPEREEEIKTLNFAFVNQNYPPKQVLKTIQEYQESDGNKEENKRAEERTESIVVPYIKGVSEKLRRDLGKEDINVVFKRGQTLHSIIFNGKFKKKDGRKKDLIYKIPCRDCTLCYIGETAQWYDEREKQHKRCIRNQDENNALFRHIRTTGHEIAWDKVEFIAFETRTQCRKMKESFYIDMYAAKNGVMNPRDGTQKDTCWNMIIPILNKI